MRSKRALQLALNFLIPLQEAGSIFDSYIEDEEISDAEYQEMLSVLGKLVDDAETQRSEFSELPFADAFSTRFY